MAPLHLQPEAGERFERGARPDETAEARDLLAFAVLDGPGHGLQLLPGRWGGREAVRGKQVRPGEEHADGGVLGHGQELALMHAARSGGREVRLGRFPELGAQVLEGLGEGPRPDDVEGQHVEFTPADEPLQHEVSVLTLLRHGMDRDHDAGGVLEGPDQGLLVPGLQLGGQPVELERDALVLAMGSGHGRRGLHAPEAAGRKEQQGHEEPNCQMTPCGDHAGAPSSPGGRTGRMTRKVEPFPGAPSASIWPPWASITPLTSERPMPEPCCFWTSARGERKNFSKRCARSSSVKPMPVSLTSRTMWPSEGWTPTRTVPPGGVYLMAFETRLLRICRKRSGSTRSSGRSLARSSSSFRPSRSAIG
ncbi:hypothetical protein D3C72_1246150 [compost metagenome]